MRAWAARRKREVKMIEDAKRDIGQAMGHLGDAMGHLGAGRVPDAARAVAGAVAGLTDALQEMAWSLCDEACPDEGDDE